MPSNETRFYKEAEACIGQILEENPASATFLGDHRFDEREFGGHITHFCASEGAGTREALTPALGTTWQHRRPAAQSGRDSRPPAKS